MQVTQDKVVSFDYKLTDDSGAVLDTSEGRGALSYIHGQGNIIPGLERELEGKDSGASFSADVQPSEGYGEYNEELVFDVEREKFAQIDDLKEGMQFEAETNEGKRIMSIKNVGEDVVTVDANHPLAGQTLHFEGTIVSVRSATSEELAHGHVHEDSENHE